MRPIAAALACAALAFGLLFSAPASAAHQKVSHRDPILFVHGFEGSGAQFESQAMRFESNGYPRGWVDEVDYDSTAANGSMTQVDQQIDHAIARLKKRSGRSKVDVAAHSEGTIVMYDYLTQGSMAAKRRASVAHYINIDGQEGNPGVPTLAIWATKGPTATPGRKIKGAKNVSVYGTHVQVCTSARSFIHMYKFVNGRSPAYDIVPQHGRIQIAGKALNFPQNTGASGDTVRIWPVGADGRRTTKRPIASIKITDGSQGGGAWGPVRVQAGRRYEFEEAQPGVGTLHYYYEPFVRSDYTLRLLASTAIEEYTGNRPGSMSVLMIRYKEFWGDQGAHNDRLLINGLNVCTPKLCPISKLVNAFFAFDSKHDHKTDLSQPDPGLSGVPFIQGADVYIPASTPPKGTVTFRLRSRGSRRARTLKVPDWEATPDGNGVVIQWNDFDKLTF